MILVMQSSENIASIRDAAERLCGLPVRVIEPVRKGGNSRVCRVETSAGPFALKQYPRGDDRDRQGREARALAFAGRAGLGRTPRLVAVDAEARISLFSWIDGAAIDRPSDADVEEFAAFQVALDNAIDDRARNEIGEAAEACLSGRRILANICMRLERLSGVQDDFLGFKAFLNKALGPALANGERNARQRLRELRVDFDADLPLVRRTLIPSDFGIHNALRGADGHIHFFDFEYFGWDDPGTSVGNFVLHPGMKLTSTQQRLYRRTLTAHFGADMERRFLALEPLYVLRWCAIILGEFLPERWHHRLRAGTQRDEWDAVRTEQLEKARRHLALLTAAEG
jgi:Phosphotransferase enzyme family